eukprot:12926156-Prorocentrum_lima.AAC.1
MVERHHAIVRDAFLKAWASSEKRRLHVDANQLLTAVVIAKNSLTTVGHYTPMQATMGYQPALLPDAGRGEAH